MNKEDKVRVKEASPCQNQDLGIIKKVLWNEEWALVEFDDGYLAYYPITDLELAK